MELQRRFEHRSRRGSSDTFRRILFRRARWKQRCESRKNNNRLPLPTDATTLVWYYIENFSQRHVSFSNYSERLRSRWEEGGEVAKRAHFNQALIELKTRILLRKPQDRSFMPRHRLQMLSYKWFTSDSRLGCT